MEKYKPSKEELEIVKKHNLYAGENHLGGYLRRNKEFPHGDPETWFPHLWKWVYDELDVRSVLDVGCGEGHSTKFFKDLGCEILGVDGSIQAKTDSVILAYHHIHDFNNGPFIPPKTFDLVWSCEFVEHIEEKYIDNFLKTFSYANKYIMMTYAEPGQKGWHYMNCQLEKYWVKKLSQIGFKLEPHLTEISRKIAGGGHFAKSGLILVRCN
jgi:SAM-dependent methyltransferase